MTASDGPVVESVAPRWVRRAQGFTVVSVATVAFVGSYSHMQALASGVGEGWRSWMLPISVDGMVISASLTMFVRRRSGRKGGVLAWLTLLLGLGASLAANIASAQPTLEAQALAAVYPVALLAVSELAMQQIRTVTREVPAPAPEASLQARVAAAQADPEFKPAAQTLNMPARNAGPVEIADPPSRPVPEAAPPVPGPDPLLPRAIEICRDVGRPLSGKRLNAELRSRDGKGVGSGRANKLAAAVKASQNGTGHGET